MKKYIISLLMTVMAMTASAQSIGEAFYIYRNDGGFNAFFREEVDSIVYSNYDNDSIYYDDVVSQVIYTTDSIYRIPLAAIDSVAFGVNELRISDSYIRMPEEDYVVEEADTLAQNYLLRFMSTVPDLSEGNIISVVNDTLVAQVRIDQLSWLDGNKVRIKGEKANLEDIFIEGSFTLSTGQAPNNSISHPHIYYPVEIRYSDSDGTSRRFIRHDDTEFTHSLYSQSIDYSGTDIHKTDHTRLYLETCRFDFNLDLVMKCNFSSATEAGDKYSHGELALQKSVIRGTVDTDFMLRFDASGQKKFDGEETMLKRNLHKPFGAKFIVAGVPVYVEMTTHLLMDASYDIEGDFSAYSGYATNNTAELGFSWSQATGLRPYSRYNTSFTFHKPTIEGKAHLESKITVFPRITFSLYGLVGPSFDIKPYLRPVIDIGFYDQFGSNEADYYGAKCNLFTGYDAAVGLTFLSSLGKQPIVMSKPWNVVNKLLFESPKKIQFKEGCPERLTPGKPMKTTFHVTDYDYLFKKEYDTELPFAVKFTTNSGSLSNDFSLIDITTGDVSITWIPDDNTTDGKDASIVAMMHDHEGNIITTDRWTPQKPQEVTTLSATEIERNSALLRGQLKKFDRETDNGDVGFYYNTTGQPNAGNSKYVSCGSAKNLSDDGNFQYRIYSLEPNTTYYFCAAYQGDEIIYGETNTFKTKQEITVQTNSATNITKNSATLYGQMIDFQPEAASGVVGFVYNTSGNPNTDNAFNVIAENLTSSSTGFFHAQISNLSEDTNYYFRAYCYNNGEYYYGETKSFKTTDEESILFCPDDNHPHMIDLGLPSGTLWSCCNKGAHSPEEFGDFYRWDEMSDAPSVEQWKELWRNCSNSGVKYNGTMCSRHISNINGASILIPYIPRNYFDDQSLTGYWTSTHNIGEIDGEVIDFGIFIYVDGDWNHDSYTSYRFAIRPVSK